MLLPMEPWGVTEKKQINEKNTENFCDIREHHYKSSGNETKTEN